MTPERLHDLVREMVNGNKTATTLARAIEAEVREQMERLFWEACQPHGKVGEVVYMTYKTKRDAARLNTQEGT